MAERPNKLFFNNLASKEGDLDTPDMLPGTTRDSLAEALRAYKEDPLTPESVGRFFGAFWRVAGEKAGFTYNVPQCDRTPEELAKLTENGRGILLLPDDIFTPEGLIRLGKAFPKMISRVTDPGDAARIFHKSPRGGNIDVEMSPDAPFRTARGYTQEELEASIAKEGKSGMRLPTYIVGSQVSWLLTREYFDKNTVSRLSGSFDEGRMLLAFFHSFGELVVSSIWGPMYQGPYLGGRSEGVKNLNL